MVKKLSIAEVTLLLKAKMLVKLWPLLPQPVMRVQGIKASTRITIILSWSESGLLSKRMEKHFRSS